MVRALADMPERLAEEAVTRYARSIDDHVRNRQGFMVRGTGHGGVGGAVWWCVVWRGLRGEGRAPRPGAGLRGEGRARRRGSGHRVGGGAAWLEGGFVVRPARAARCLGTREAP